jgi:long-chain acyl-CoA synthetase
MTDIVSQLPFIYDKPELKKATVQPRIYKRGPFSKEVEGVEAVEGETIPRRNPDLQDRLVSRPSPDIYTTFDVVRTSAVKYGNAKALGTRKLIKTHKETRKIKRMVDGVETEVDKVWTYFELSGYNYRSFIDYEKMVLSIGAGLRKLGMVKDDRLHIFAATSANWLGMSHGAASQTMPIVTAYDTLGEEGLNHSLVATGAKAIFLDPHLLPTIVNPLRDAKEIKYVIYNTEHEVNPAHIDHLNEVHPGLTILSIDELIKLGEDNLVDPVPPTADDLCCIMYTSGSTGTPKGVPLKHKQVIAARKFFALIPSILS